MNINVNQLKKEGWMSVSEACEYFSISERTLQRWYSENKVSKMSIGGGRVLYREITEENHLEDEKDFSPPGKDYCEEDNSSSNGPSLNSSKNYWYDENMDIYVFYSKNKKEPFFISGEVVNSILADYSSHVGKGATVEEISRKHILPSDNVREIIKILGKTHSSSPYTDEDLKSLNEHELVENLLKMKEEQILQKAQRIEFSFIKKDAEKWRDFQKNALEDIFEKIDKAANSYKVPKLDFNISNKNKRRFAAVMTPTDFHYGKYGWCDESGTDFTREIAENRLVEKTSEAISLVTHFGIPEKFVVGAGSDWFHIDTWGGTTTAGTPQDTDGNFSQIFIEGCDLAVRYIDILRQVAPVEIILMSGNHDRQNSLSVLNYLYAWYRDCPDVSVRRNPAPRQYVTYGTSLLGFTHGDKPNLKYLPSIMSIEAKEEWGRSENRMWFTGDKHHEVTLDIGGVQIYQMPCLSGDDRWHVQNGFTTSRKALSAYLIDIEKGMFSSVYASVTSSDKNK